MFVTAGSGSTPLSPLFFVRPRNDRSASVMMLMTVITLWPSATPTLPLWPVIVFLSEGFLGEFGGK